MYRGLFFTSSYIRPTYSPTSPKANNCTPEKKVTTNTVVESPGVSPNPNNFCKTYQPPSIKLIPARMNPIIDIINKGLVLKLINPFKPIFKDPVKRL